MTTIFSLFCPTVLDKICQFPVYSYTHLRIHLIKKLAEGPPGVLHLWQFFNSYSQSFVIHDTSSLVRIFITRPETTYFAVLNGPINSSNFQSVYFTMKI